MLVLLVFGLAVAYIARCCLYPSQRGNRHIFSAEYLLLLSTLPIEESLLPDITYVYLELQSAALVLEMAELRKLLLRLPDQQPRVDHHL